MRGCGGEVAGDHGACQEEHRQAARLDDLEGIERVGQVRAGLRAAAGKNLIAQMLNVQESMLALLDLPLAARVKAQKSLHTVEGFMRREVGERLRLRYTPEIHFEYDESFEEGSRMEALLDSLHSPRVESAEE